MHISSPGIPRSRPSCRRSDALLTVPPSIDPAGGSRCIRTPIGKRRVPPALPDGRGAARRVREPQTDPRFSRKTRQPLCFARQPGAGACPRLLDTARPVEEAGMERPKEQRRHREVPQDGRISMLARRVSAKHRIGSDREVCRGSFAGTGHADHVVDSGALAPHADRLLADAGIGSRADVVVRPWSPDPLRQPRRVLYPSGGCAPPAAQPRHHRHSATEDRKKHVAVLPAMAVEEPLPLLPHALILGELRHELTERLRLWILPTKSR